MAPSHHKLIVSIVFWACWFLLAEVPAHIFVKWWPWYTLSRTAWTGIYYWTPAAMICTVFLIVLVGHIDDHWSVKYLLGVSILGALIIVAHLIRIYLGR